MKAFIHGNTYYSHAHPPEELERNFKQMRELGMNAVRVAEIWPGWSVIEHIPGRYDYSLLDDYVEKAVRQGMKVCMGVGINDTPFWLFAKYSNLRCVDFNGKRAVRRVQSACIDHRDYRDHMKAFIENITEHYAGVDGIFSWQLGNEIRYGVQYCDCPSTRIRFREWLKERYQNDLDALNQEWGVYYHAWEEIYPYKSSDGPPTEGISTHCIRTKEYQNWSLEELIRWGTAIMRQYTDQPIFHNNFGLSGENGSHWKLTEACDLSVIDIYAITYEKPGVYNGLLLEIARSVASQQNKPLWIGETTAGQYGTYNRIYVDQKLIENCVIEQIGAGAEAVFYFRHKAPIWEQPHKFTGSQTFLRIDESELPYAKTPRNVAALMEKFAPRILSARPVDPMVGIYYPSESIIFGKEAGYYQDSLDSAFGARAIWAGAQVPVEILASEGICSLDLSRFKIIHLPVSYLLPAKVGQALREYVRQGGTLISEARPGYVDENGLLYQTQPGAGLDEVFGAKEDLFYNLKDFKANINITGPEQTLVLPVLLQTYRPAGGQAFATTENGAVCGVLNRYGKGQAYIFGGAPSLHFRIGNGKYGDGKKAQDDYGEQQREAICGLFKELGLRHGVAPPVKFTGGLVDLTVRYLRNETELLLFCINYHNIKSATIRLDSSYPNCSQLTGDGEAVLNDGSIEIPPYLWKIIVLKDDSK